jgi:hypothetical protein
MIAMRRTSRQCPGRALEAAQEILTAMPVATTRLSFTPVSLVRTAEGRGFETDRRRTGRALRTY